MNTSFILAIVVLVLVGGQVAATRNKKNHPRKTTIASFNAAINPFFVGANGNSEIEERVALLIQHVYIWLLIFLLCLMFLNNI